MSVDFTPTQNSYKELGAFRFWCQKVLPAVYDDSLSYYEALCKLTNCLNDVIENMNKVGEDTRALYNAFVHLQDYVNHYFDNLDVQNEINNALDRMSSDGSLSELIQPLFNEYKEEVNTIIASQNRVIQETLDNQDGEIGALKSRMDNFSALEPGSTTGDAELTDGRVGYNGKIYPNIGDAIRNQTEENHLFNTLISKVSSTIQLFDKLAVTENVVIDGTGELVPFDGFYVTDYIPVVSTEYYLTTYIPSLTGNRGIAFDKNKNVIGECDATELSNNAGKIVMPVGSYFVRFTIVNPQIFSVTPFFLPNKVYDYGAIIARDEKTQSTVANNFYTNHYAVTATPNISSDNNYYLKPSNDLTDRSYDIASMLATTGVCNLGSGTFYVKNVTIPSGGIVRGCGYNTRVILIDDNDAEYCFKLMSNTCVENMQLCGVGGSIGTPSSVGSRNGVVFEGEANLEAPSYLVRDAVVNNLWVSNFTGGGITCRNTGYPAQCSLNVTNCAINNCGAGINIPYFSEYHRFTNVNCCSCYVGCVNNGGNNMFVNCGFSQNILGFLMDNQDGAKPNPAHGSAVGCVFNHSDSNAGTGIKVINMSAGFVFSGCQLFYSKVELIDASGIIISDSNFGNANGINITNGGLIMFNSCMFGSAPIFNINNNNNVKVNECYTRGGTVVSL